MAWPVLDLRSSAIIWRMALLFWHRDVDFRGAGFRFHLPTSSTIYHRVQKYFWPAEPVFMGVSSVFFLWGDHLIYFFSLPSSTSFIQ